MIYEPLKSRADIMKFAIILTSDIVYYDGGYKQELNLTRAKEVYDMFNDLDIPDYEKPVTEDIVKCVKEIMEK